MGQWLWTSRRRRTGIRDIKPRRTLTRAAAGAAGTKRYFGRTSCNHQSVGGGRHSDPVAPDMMRRQARYSLMAGNPSRSPDRWPGRWDHSLTETLLQTRCGRKMEGTTYRSPHNMGKLRCSLAASPSQRRVSALQPRHLPQAWQQCRLAPWRCRQRPRPQLRWSGASAGGDHRAGSLGCSRAKGR